jgi:hypothetical protein
VHVTNQHLTVGLSSTLLAVVVPPTLLDYAGKLIFAVLTAIVTTIVSALVAQKMARLSNKDK